MANIKMISDLDGWEDWDNLGHIKIDEGLRYQLNLEENEYILLHKDMRNEIGVVVGDQIVKIDYSTLNRHNMLNNGDLIVLRSRFRH